MAIKFKDFFHPYELGQKIGSDIGASVNSAVSSIHQQNIDTQKYISENQPTWNMTGLQNAGLNPALAAGGNLTSSPSSPSIDTSINSAAIAAVSKLLSSVISGAFKLGNSAVGVAAKAASA